MVLSQFYSRVMHNDEVFDSQCLDRSAWLLLGIVDTGEDTYL